jgi:hypothetical protein
MGPPLRKRPKKDKAPRTSAESDLRLQSMKSLLELIRDEEPDKSAESPVPPPPGNAAANTASISNTASGAQRAPAPTRPNYPGICAICLSRRSRVSGIRGSSTSNTDMLISVMGLSPSVNLVLIKTGLAFTRLIPTRPQQIWFRDLTNQVPMIQCKQVL